MKKVMVLVLVLALALGSGVTALAEGEATEIEFWTFQTLHVEFYEEMAREWNEQNPDRQIVLKPDVYREKTESPFHLIDFRDSPIAEPGFIAA